MQYEPSDREYQPTNLYRVKFQETVSLIITVLKASNLVLSIWMSGDIFWCWLVDATG